MLETGMNAFGMAQTSNVIKIVKTAAPPIRSQLQSTNVLSANLQMNLRPTAKNARDRTATSRAYICGMNKYSREDTPEGSAKGKGKP